MRVKSCHETVGGNFCREALTLRAKGTLISEPRFSTPCEMRFFPREKGETAFSKKKPSTKAVSPFSRGKNRISQGVENRGSLISVPLALRVDASQGPLGVHRINEERRVVSLYVLTGQTPLIKGGELSSLHQGGGVQKAL